MRTLNKTEEAILSAYRLLKVADKDCVMVAAKDFWIEITIKPKQMFYLGQGFRVISVDEAKP